MAAASAGVDDLAGEHARRSGHQDPHGRVSSEASPTIIRSVFGSPSARVIRTPRPSRLASIREGRSRTLAPASRIECSTSELATSHSEPIEV